MGTLRYRKDKKLWEWRSPPGEPEKSIASKDKAKCLEKVAEYQRDLDLGLDFDARKQTVSEYLDRWLAEAVKGNVVHATYAFHERQARLHLKPELGRLKLRDLTKMHVQAMFNRKAKDLSPSSLRSLKATLHKAMAQAVDWDLLVKNPADRIRLPRLARARRETLSREGVAAFFDAAGETSPRFEALYVLAVATGMRPGELLALKWRDVDLARGTVEVRATLTDGPKGPEIRDSTKTHRDRAIALPPSAVAALKAHALRQKKERMRYKGLWPEGAHPHAGLVFPSVAGTVMRRQNLQKRSFKPLLRAAGLPDMRMVDLRHSFATLMRASGEDLKSVQVAMGHSTIKTTGDYYTHTDAGQMRDAAARLDAYLSDRYGPGKGT
jgi:integrase